MVLRDARRARGWRQSDLAQRLGVRFQQVQKYESGEVRISASMLAKASQALQTPIDRFFQGLPDPVSATPAGRDQDQRAAALLAEPDGRPLIEALLRLPTEQVRAVLVLLRSLA